MTTAALPISQQQDPMVSFFQQRAQQTPQPNQAATPAPTQTDQAASADPMLSYFQKRVIQNSGLPDYLANDPNFQAMSPQEQQAVVARHARSREGKSFGAASEPGTLESFATGVGKGGTETIQGVTNIAKKAHLPIPGVLSNEKGTGLADAVDTEAHGTAETVGKVGENILEFVSGDEALKGLSLADKLKIAERLGKLAESSPKIAKAIDIGLNAVRTGTVAGTQETVKTGGDIRAGAETGLASAGLGAALEGVAAAKPLQAVKRLLVPEEINPEELKEPPRPVSPHTKTELPLDDATIRKSFNKELSQEARDTLRQAVGNSVQAGSSVENTLMKGVAPVNQTIEEQGLLLNKALQSAGEMKTNSAAEVTSALERLKKPFDLEAEKSIRDAMDSELAKAREAILSQKPIELNDYIRELDRQIKSYTAPEEAIDTVSQARDAAKVTIRRVLREKLSTELPATKPINDTLAKNLELRGALRNKFGDVAYDSVAADAQHLSELQKGQAHISWEQKVADLRDEYQKAVNRAKLIKQGLGIAGLSAAGGALGVEALKHLVP